MTHREWIEFHRQLRGLERALSGVRRAAARAIRVSPIRGRALLAVEECGETGVVGLAVHLGVNKGTASRTVDGLVAAGLATRRADPSNRRRRIVVLTARGRRAAAGINRRLIAYTRLLLARMPRSRQRAIADGVRLLAEAAAAAPPGAADGRVPTPAR